MQNFSFQISAMTSCCDGTLDRIFDVLVRAHKHISEFEDQDDFDNAFYKLHRERQDSRTPGRPHHGQDQRFKELCRSP